MSQQELKDCISAGDRHWKVVFWVSLVLSAVLVVVSFVVPPRGIIDGSVLAAVGEIFAFPTLYAVYGQMAKIFYDEELYQQQLQYTDFSVKYSWQANDTLAALMSYEQKYLAYQRLGLIDSAVFVIEDVASKYEQHGYCQYSAIALGAIVRTLVDKGDYPKAKAYMDKYESNSGLFDAKGNIAPRREIYYKAKGLYYLYNNVLDSAEYYFRKELRDGKDYNNQNAAAMGLAMLFQKQLQTDSSSKYSIYAYIMNDSMYAQKATNTVERMQAMYNYNRHQKEAHQEKEKANRRFVIICICMGIIIIICLSTYIIIRELSQKKKDAEQKYLQSLDIIEQARHDITKLHNSEETNRELISEKEQIIHEQEIILKSLLHQDINSHSLANKKLKDTDIYLKFEQLSAIGQIPAEEEWNQLQSQISIHFPGFHDFMQEHNFHLSDKERKTCLLLRIGFKPSSIGNMIGVTASYITELRSKMLQKIFGISGNSKTFDKMITGIY